MSPHPTPDPPGRSLRAVVADDDPLARRMVSDVLERAGVEVVAQARDGAETIELVRRHEPDIVLMDVMMPRLDGVAATREIVGERPEQVVILLTHAADDELGVIGLRAGAVGYLSKELELEALPRVIDAALAGEAAISRSLAMRLIEHLRHAPPEGRGLRPVHSPLSSREWEVLDLLSQTLTTQEIADALVVSPETVRYHVKSILRKLGVRSRGEAVAAARRLRGLPH